LTQQSNEISVGEEAMIEIPEEDPENAWLLIVLTSNLMQNGDWPHPSDGKMSNTTDTPSQKE